MPLTVDLVDGTNSVKIESSAFIVITDHILVT